MAILVRSGGIAVVAMAMSVMAAAAAEPRPNITMLHLDQTAEATVPRDRITVEMRVEAVGSDQSRVQADVNRRMAAALVEARHVDSVDTMTGDYRTYQQSVGSGVTSVRSSSQWHAMQSLILVSQDFGAAVALAGRLQAEGLTVGDMRFDVAPATLRSWQKALTEEALRELTARAATIAGTVSLRVDHIERLTVGNAMQAGSAPHAMMMAGRAAGSPAPAPPAVAAGTAPVSVTVGAEVAMTPRP
jgi:predicted secreted protein